MIAICTYSERYRDGVANLILPIQQEEFGVPITLQDQPDLLDIPNFYQSGHGNFWLALAGEEVVGSISLRDIGNGQGALRKMFVQVPFRGREHQVAHRLLQTLVEWSREQGLKEIYLGTTAAFLAAHRFYEKNGFAEITAAELPPAFPRMKQDTRFYRLGL
ncbi:Protein export cytoplasm protein SecA ATPase RNA helicase [Collimonas arenae]|uniref:Protein export cytoplasm protein SecA ATPase RNA helicase n=1 Tax=Collimonas arenae TaxID=279058 RepID=A0A0A1F962_9BURK|nr:GNAT family N-acetyltransferase [Collimonas arenae]AIY39397.1 Protein export cytoplasm protein SecA ATPase RNA helicase [Collimonas arenae]